MKSSSMEVPQKNETELLHAVVISFLFICLKEMKLVCPKDSCTPMSIAALFTTANTWNQSQCPLLDE